MLNGRVRAVSLARVCAKGQTAELISADVLSCGEAPCAVLTCVFVSV